MAFPFARSLTRIFKRNGIEAGAGGRRLPSTFTMIGTRMRTRVYLDGATTMPMRRATGPWTYSNNSLADSEE